MRFVDEPIARRHAATEHRLGKLTAQVAGNDETLRRSRRRELRLC